MKKVFIYFEYDDSDKNTVNTVEYKMTYPPVLLRSVYDLEFTARTQNCIKSLNVFLIGDLVRFTERDLLAKPKLGIGSLNEIKDSLASHGLALGMILDNWPPKNYSELIIF